MRQVVLPLLITLAGPAMASQVPDLICSETKSVQIESKALSAQSDGTDTIYRFKSGSLHLKPSDRDEYLYNKVVEIEFGRYSSGHKTIIFDSINSNNFESAIVVHANSTEVRVTRLLCIRP